MSYLPVLYLRQGSAIRDDHSLQWEDQKEIPPKVYLLGRDGKSCYTMIVVQNNEVYNSFTQYKSSRQKPEIESKHIAEV